MTPRTMPEALASAERRFGARAAIDDEGLVLTFADVAQAARSIASAFLAAGLEKGIPVGLWAQNSAQWIVTALGIQIAGGVLVPLNTRLRGTEIAAVLDRSGARWLVSCGEFLGRWYPAQLAGHPLPALERILVLDGDPRDAREESWTTFMAAGSSIAPLELEHRMASITGDDLVDIMFTSGTTGRPKGAMFAHRQTLAAAEALGQMSGMGETDRYCAFGPFSHTAAYKGGWAAALVAGALVFPQRVHDAETILRLVHEKGVTILPAPPPVYRAILDHPDREAFDLSSLRYASTGASSVPPEIYFRIKSELRVPRVGHSYGLTESCGMATCARAEDPIDKIAHSSGRPTDDTELRIVDGAGRDVENGATGEILLRNRCVMLGYLDDPEGTRDAIDDDGWLHTGDVGHIDPDGHIYITDRMKDMYIVGGFNVYPAEVETLLEQMDGVAQCATIGIPDERMGEVGLVFVVRTPGSTIDEAAVIAWSRENMANFKVPRSVRFVDALPTNATGKVLKPELRRAV